MSRLVEREALLARLADARRDGGRLLLVGGEAGVGKTALVRAFAADIDRRVLFGACEHLVTPAPLGPLVDVADQVGGVLADDIEAARDPRRVALAVLDELRERAVLVVEDVHWADEATLDVLRVLGRRIAGSPSLVIATYRDDEAVGVHPLRGLLGDLASTEAVERLDVPPLSLAAVRELAEAHEADAEHIHALTGGNPFFVTELLASGGEAVPATVRDAVLARIAALSPPARSLLEGASLVPARAELSVLDAAFPDVASSVDECVTAGVLESAANAVAFRHELARRAVESTVPPRRRRDLHAAILRALEASRGADSSRLAHHAEEAGDTEAILRHGRAAAQRGAMTGAHREATAQYARVLRHADAVLPAERADLLSAYANEAQASGSNDEAVAALNEAIEIRRRLGDPLRAGEHLARLTQPCFRLGRNAEAEAAVRAATELLNTLPPSPEPRARDRVRVPGVRGDAQARQRRRRAVGRAGRDSRAPLRRPADARVRAEHLGDGARHGRRDRARRSAPGAEPRRRHDERARAADRPRPLDARIGAGGDVRARARRALAARPHRVRGRARPGVDVHARVARRRARVSRAVDRGRCARGRGARRRRAHDQPHHGERRPGPCSCAAGRSRRP